MKILNFTLMLLVFTNLIFTSSTAQAHGSHNANFQTENFPRIGIDPDHDFNYNGPAPKLPVKVCQVDSKVTLNQKDVTVEDVLKFLERFPEAIPHVTAFREMQQRGEIAVEQYTDSIKRRIGGPRGVVATYEYKPNQKVQYIYVDMTEELGTLAVYFYHEMMHSLDPDLKKFYNEFDARWSQIEAGKRAVFQNIATRMKKKIEEVSFGDFKAQDWTDWKNAKRFENDGQWNAEYHAFTKQMVLIEQMKTQVKCVKNYIFDQFQKNGVRLAFDDIKGHLYQTYGLYDPSSY